MFFFLLIAILYSPVYVTAKEPVCATVQSDTVASVDYRNATVAYKEKRYGDAVKLWKVAAKAGNDNAMCNLGTCYSKGIGVASSQKQALKWWRSAAENGK